MDASWRRCGDASRGPVPVSVSGLVGLGESRRTDRDHEQGDSDQLSHRDTPLLFVVTKTVIAAAQPATNMWTTSLAGLSCRIGERRTTKLGKVPGTAIMQECPTTSAQKDWRLKANSWRPATG